MSRLRRALHVAKEALWGLFFYELYTENMKMQIRYNDAVNLLVFSEQLGIPLMNSYVSMRLLPHFVEADFRVADEGDHSGHCGSMPRHSSGTGTGCPR